MSRGSAVLSS